MSVMTRPQNSWTVNGEWLCLWRPPALESENVRTSKRGNILLLFFFFPLLLLLLRQSLRSLQLGRQKVRQLTKRGKILSNQYPLHLFPVVRHNPRVCRSTRSGSGTTTRHWWRCWRSSPPSRCPPPCCSRSCRCCSRATTPSAPPRSCTRARSTSPSPWSPTVPEVRGPMLLSSFYSAGGTDPTRLGISQRLSGGVFRGCDVVFCFPLGGQTCS